MAAHIFAIFFGGFLLIYRVIHSPFGQVLKAIRENEARAISLENYLAQLGAWVTIVQGIIFVICVLTFRRGVIGELGNWLKKPL